MSHHANEEWMEKMHELNPKASEKTLKSKMGEEVKPHKIKKSMAKKMHKKGSFIKQLEAHKKEGASFDNGTWKPKYKGQTFIQALEAHKADKRFL